MKDKEKQIEEMEYDISYVDNNAYYYDEYGYQQDAYANCHKIAEELIKIGWIKPNEDSVVLSKEEYERLKGERKYCNCEILMKLVSKETTENIINDILEFLKVCPNIITSSYTTYYEEVPLREYLIELAENNSMLK
jgi:hypothetical protein